MAYKRRYLAGQLAVTVDIAEQAVTTDKIGDEAVGNAQLKDDSISTGKIVDGDVKAVDIGAQAVETAKIKDGAVTTVKLADAAVTTEKLSPEVASSVRPLTPGVSSAEIADAAVIAAKLGAEAVETAKIKDGAVATAKIAADAVDNTKIADDAVDSEQIVASAVKTSELDNLSVSEGKIINGSVSNAKIADGAVYGDKIPNGGVEQNKIAADAVQTLQIEDLAVTGPKLATAALTARLRSSYSSRVIDLGEEFGGAAISNRWAKVLSIGGSVYLSNDKGLIIKSGSGAGWPSRIDFGGHSIGQPGTILPNMDIWITERNFADFLTNTLGLWNDSANYIAFYANAPAGVAQNWFAHCKVGNVLTAVDTGVLVSTGIQLLSFEVISAASVKFYINGNEVAEITTNIPAAVDVEPYLSLESRAGATDKTMAIKYVSLLLDRPDYP